MLEINEKIAYIIAHKEEIIGKYEIKCSLNLYKKFSYLIADAGIHRCMRELTSFWEVKRSQQGEVIGCRGSRMTRVVSHGTLWGDNREERIEFLNEELLSTISWVYGMLTAVPLFSTRVTRFSHLSRSDSKDLYKKLAKELHPDSGGSHAEMCLLNEEYSWEWK